MTSRRRTAAWGTFLLIGGLIGGTLGYGAYYRSDYYRRGVESDLTRFFGLPTQVGAIGPDTFTSRELKDVVIWLPERRARVFSCPRVVWAEGAAGVGGTLLDVHDAILSIGSDDWEKEDYMRVLRASLQHDFEELDVREIRFHNARFDWPREDFRLTAAGVEGVVVFDQQGRGQAELTSHSLNGVTVAEPIRIQARLDPEAEDSLPEVTLTVPPLPLPGLGLDEMLGSAVTQGSFAGRVTLRQLAGPDEIELSGRAEDLRLEELTQRLAGGPVSALLNVAIERALFTGRQLKEIAFRGELRGLNVDELAAGLGWPRVGGTARLSVNDARVTSEGIERLDVTGEWTGIELDEIAYAAFGRRGIRGPLRVRINQLVIEDSVPVQGEIDIDGTPPAGETGEVDLDLLTDVLEARFGLRLPGVVVRLLPERVEYVHLGARLRVEGDWITLQSGEGPAGPALITLKVPSGNMPLLGGRRLSFPLTPILSRVQAKAEMVRREWQPRWVRPGESRPTD